MEQALLRALEKSRLSATIVGAHSAPQFMRFKLRFAEKPQEYFLDDLAFELAIDLNLSEKPALSWEGEILLVELPCKQRRTVELADFSIEKKHGAIVLPLGEGVDGEKRYFDLCKAPHVWLSGGTGTGKSVLAQAWIATLAKEYAQEVKLVLIDLKQVEFCDWKNTDLLFQGLYVDDCPQTLRAFETLLAEMESRYRTFAEAQVRNLDEYNAQANIPLPKIVVMIDEFTTMRFWGERKLFSYLQMLLQKCRPAGIYFVMISQPDFSGDMAQIMGNVPTRVAFKMFSHGDSRDFLGDAAATALLGWGDAIVKLAQGDCVRVQTPWIAYKERQELACEHKILN